MPDSPLDFSQTDKPRQIQENMIAYMRLFDGLDGTLMEDGDTFWIITGDRAPGNNLLKAHWQDVDVEQQIDALFEKIGQHLDGIDWFVFPSDQPADLGKRLEARGMPPGPGGIWLWCDLSNVSDTSSHIPDSFHIEQVRDDQMLAEWNRLSEVGFGGEQAIFYDAYARHGYGEDAFSLHYIGYDGDKAVTSGTLLDAGGWASLYDISTPPEFRGQGFGGAITYAMMLEIRKRGYSDTWIWSSPMAKSVYKRLGCVDADFGLREYAWRKV